MNIWKRKRVLHVGEHLCKLSSTCKTVQFYWSLYAFYFCNFLSDLIEFYFRAKSTFCMGYSNVLYFYF